MDNTITLSLSPLQLILSLAVQLWIIAIFPFIIIRKINYLIYMLEDQSGSNNGEAENLPE